MKARAISNDEETPWRGRLRRHLVICLIVGLGCGFGSIPFTIWNRGFASWLTLIAIVSGHWALSIFSIHMLVQSAIELPRLRDKGIRVSPWAYIEIVLWTVGVITMIFMYVQIAQGTYIPEFPVMGRG